MTDYKQTLNLPKTKFSMKANLGQREPERLKKWQAMDLYATQQAQQADRPMFVLHDGPPYANAAIHLGTGLQKILKDIVMKSKVMSGFHVPYVPGWDCHGLPIELNVEKKVGKAGAKLSHEAFRKACREYATKQVAVQKEDFQRLGVFGEWQNPYLTMNQSYEADEMRALATIIENGHFERGQKPVHWCIECGSALAEAEVVYKDKDSPAIDVGFFAVTPGDFAKAFGLNDALDNVIVPIWTTTPWTLPANQAVSMNPNFDYVLIRCELAGQRRHLVMAKALIDSVMTRYGVSDYQVLAEVKGEALESLQLQHPFIDRVVPITLGDHVTIEAGTGNVHTAPAHGLDDYAIGGRYHLPEDNPVDSRCCFVEGTPLVGGQHVFKANPIIVEALRESGHLLHDETINHSYPHCWRHKKPLIFRATPQWFVSMDKNGLRAQALEAVKTVRWHPTWGEQRITNMIETRPDWCISRQRTWGVPIAVFIHRDTGEAHPDSAALMRRVADIVEEKGIDAWYELNAADLLGDDADAYEKVTDTLDVWLDAGVSHACVLAKRDELRLPADLYFEGSDQYRGWFQSSILTSLAMHGHAPTKQIVTHGYVVDGHGHKMSKSVGNVLAPKELVKQLGADVLRLWVSSSDFTDDIRQSDEIFKRCSDAYRRIRNTARFLISNLYDFDPAKDLLPGDQLVALDRWAIVAAKQLQEKIITAYEEYHFQSIYQMVHNFCTVEMGSFYLDIIKDRLYTAASNSVARRSAQTAMYHILEAFVRWMAPILCYTADEIWEYIPGDREASVFLAEWYHGFDEVAVADDIDWGQLIPLRDAVNKVLETHRQAGEIGSGLDASVSVYANSSLYPELQKLQDELRFVLITSDAVAKPLEEAVEAASATDIEGVKVLVSVSPHEKCERCWQRREAVGQNAAHETLCERCVDNIDSDGEERQFA